MPRSAWKVAGNATVLSMKRLFRGGILSVLATLGGCDSDTVSQGCTLIGCASGIEVVLEQPPAVPYRVEAYVSSQMPRYVYRCDSGSCLPRIFFEEFTPFRVFVEVISGTGTQVYEVIPRYSESRPNGPQCDPLCRNAVIRLPSDRLRPPQTR